MVSQSVDLRGASIVVSIFLSRIDAAPVSTTSSARTAALPSARKWNGKFPWDWRVIVNAKLKKLLFDREILVADGLAFLELKRRTPINPKVDEHPEKEGFSARIREGVTGL